MPNKTVYEGGDDFKDADVDAKPKSKQDKQLDKHQSAMDGYSVKENSKIVDGPVKDRGCTDVICLGVFIIFLVGMFSVTSYCFAEGDVAKYLAPVSSDLNICGSGDYKNKTFLAFNSFTNPFGNSECVAKCPDCYKSTFKYCFPDGSTKPACADVQLQKEALESSFEKALNENPVGALVMDLYKSSRAIYISIATAIILCFGYIYLMSFFAEQIAWTIIGITQLSLFVGTGVCVFEYIEYNGIKKGSSDYKVAAQTADGFLVGSIVLGLAAIIMLIMLICGFNQLKTAIDVIDASADFLRKTKRVILVPVVYFFLQVFAVLTFMFALCCLWSIGEITVSTGSGNTEHQLKYVKFANGTAGDMYYLATGMFFGLLWILAFFNAQQSFIVMVSGCSYYFDSNKEKEGSADVGMGVKMAWVNHIGSLAFGAFIVAVVEFLRIVVATIVEQATKASGENPVVKCIGCVANCYMDCLQKVIEYINKAAYAYMAVAGDGFCTSAWNGFLLNLKHSLEFAWARILAELFIFVGKISLVAVNCLLLWVTMNFITMDMTGSDKVSSIYSPMVVVALITYVAASVFLGLFSNTVLSLMTCLAIDVDLNGEPKFGPPTFHDSLDNFRVEKKNAIADGGWDKSDPEASKGNAVE